MPGEFDLIAWIRAQQAPDATTLAPAGDDLAILRWPANDLLLIGVDQVLDGVHFDSKIHSPQAIGAKVMNRNLSDCAAMAALPVAAVITFALPSTANIDYAKKIYEGIRDAGQAIASPPDAPEKIDPCKIAGGDTAVWPGPLAITCAILGRAGGINPIQRNGARAGDGIYVTGPLGGSILGRHMTFTPRVALARQLTKSCTITAMIDLSDGLSRDLAHIAAESQVGATLNADLIPIHPDAVKLSESHSPGKPQTPEDHALNDGEDYELLFTSPDCKDPRAILIGAITDDRKIRIRRGSFVMPLHSRGFEHQIPPGADSQ